MVFICNNFVSNGKERGGFLKRPQNSSAVVFFSFHAKSNGRSSKTGRAEKEEELGVLT